MKKLLAVMAAFGLMSAVAFANSHNTAAPAGHEEHAGHVEGDKAPAESETTTHKTTTKTKAKKPAAGHDAHDTGTHH